MSNPRFPDLQVIENKLGWLLFQDKVYRSSAIDNPEFEITCFCQAWGSTCTGFDIDINGKPVCGGQMITKEYTTVVHELNVNWYVIFFGNRPAYIIDKISDNFLEDLKNKNMASVSKAKERYRCSP